MLNLFVKIMSVFLQVVRHKQILQDFYPHVNRSYPYKFMCGIFGWEVLLSAHAHTTVTPLPPKRQPLLDVQWQHALHQQAGAGV